MNRYEVTMVYYKTVEVIANNEDEASEKAHAGEWESEEELVESLEEDEVDMLEADV